jgi:hypothetical protein
MHQRLLQLQHLLQAPLLHSFHQILIHSRQSLCQLHHLFPQRPSMPSKQQWQSALASQAMRHCFHLT